jgi:hypothetical protein
MSCSELLELFKTSALENSFILQRRYIHRRDGTFKEIIYAYDDKKYECYGLHGELQPLDEEIMGELKKRKYDYVINKCKNRCMTWTRTTSDA